MRGLPDSAVYGSYRRLSRGINRRSKSEIGLLDILIEWIERIHAKEEKKKKLKEVRGY